MTASKNDFMITKATPGDAQAIMGLIQELADFEKMPHGPQINAETVAADIKRNAVFGYVARQGEEVAGMALCYYAYSTWQGQYIHLEDLYVRQKFRKQGLAKKLLIEVVKQAHGEGMKRVNWHVLDWNEGARTFYAKIGAMDLSKEEGWLVYRLDEKRIAELVEKANQENGKHH
ncbi:GNAT domain containing protein [Aphelenchoides avenae]|nr:GNAT domain containing protein [Aphelenchus avenae]